MSGSSGSRAPGGRSPGGAPAVTVLDRPIDALAVARRLAASGRAWFWFDGAVAAPGEASMSYLGTSSEVRYALPGGEREFLDLLRRAFREECSSDRGFAGGWALALGYEFGVGLLGVSAGDADRACGRETAFALRTDLVLAVDHRSGTAELRGGTAAQRERWTEAFLRDGGDDAGECGAPDRSPEGPTERAAEADARWRADDGRYADRVEACKRAIAAGDAYVLCLTDTAELRGAFDPVGVYAALRASGSAIRGGVIAAGGTALVSASPERFLSVAAGRVSTHPIKGTRPRGATPREDAALAAELAADPKERAENLMIVDLMRNDLSRVCVPGSVAVDGFLRVETHPHVHQLVSTVTGRLRKGADAIDAIHACFPGGSMTGAPKRRAVEILASLEDGPRGLYSGCFGWIDAGGDAELAMTIRSVELRDGIASVGAGGGITADSIAAHEVAEKHLKAAAVLAGIRAAR
ncbi:anthranilate synthase component I family protein [Leucobacter zeae]|nr:anthranilate synthase component I family protein [Leucobacter zeae]